nr:J99 [uncultured bacterium]
MPGRLAAAADAFGDRRNYRVDAHVQSPVVRSAPLPLPQPAWQRVLA